MTERNDLVNRSSYCAGNFQDQNWLWHKPGEIMLVNGVVFSIVADYTTKCPCRNALDSKFASPQKQKFAINTPLHPNLEPNTIDLKTIDSILYTSSSDISHWRCYTLLFTGFYPELWSVSWLKALLAKILPGVSTCLVSPLPSPFPGLLDWLWYW